MKYLKSMFTCKVKSPCCLKAPCCLVHTNSLDQNGHTTMGTDKSCRMKLSAYTAHPLFEAKCLLFSKQNSAAVLLSGAEGPHYQNDLQWHCYSKLSAYNPKGTHLRWSFPIASDKALGWKNSEGITASRHMFLPNVKTHGIVLKTIPAILQTKLTSTSAFHSTILLISYSSCVSSQTFEQKNLSNRGEKYTTFWVRCFCVFCLETCLCTSPLIEKSNR